MSFQRTDRLNSILKRVIAEVIRREVKHPDLHPMTTVSSVEITKDLRHAKVYVSILADELQQEATLKALKASAGFIAVTSSKKVVMRYFPQLTFYLDETVKKQMEIQEALKRIEEERRSRE